jgi:hypothetical protein
MVSPALVLGLTLLAGGTPPGAELRPAAAQAGAVSDAPSSVERSAPDSSDLLREARDAQRRFESTRIRLSPQSNRTGIGPCDEFVGRFCIRLPQERPGEEPRPWSPPPEHPTITAAREDLLETLERVGRAIPGAAWVSGQHVAYLTEVDRWDEALEVARRCTATGWWCRGLEGYVLHGMGRVVEAEAAFDEVLEQLPAAVRRDWLDPRPLVEPELWRTLDRARGWQSEVLRERVWRLASPLFLLEGNVVRTEHLARRVLAEARADARNHHGIRWSDDLTELLVRYGPEVAYERLREPLSHMGPPPVAAYFDRRGRHLMPSAEAVARPAASTPEEWRTDRRSARSRHVLPHAPRIRGMNVQLARFQRGDEVLVAAAWALERPPAPTAEDSLRVARGDLDPAALPPPFPPSSLASGFFLLAEDAAEPGRHRTVTLADTAGIATARARPGGYLVSLEALEPGKKGWRHRQGLQLSVRPPEVVGLSDLLLLAPETRAVAGDPSDPGTLAPASLDDLLPRAHPTTRLPPAPVEVVWEVYGLSQDEAVLAFHLEAAPRDRGLLRRAGERLGLVSTPSPVTLRWEEGVRRDLRPREPHLRRVVLDLSGLDPGSYSLTLTLEVLGREPASTVRDVELVR